jgi:hypothetical protein
MAGQAQKMGCYRLSRRVNKMGFIIDIYISPIQVLKNCTGKLNINCSIESINIPSYFVYDQLGCNKPEVDKGTGDDPPTYRSYFPTVQLITPIRAQITK